MGSHSRNIRIILLLLALIGWPMAACQSSTGDEKVEDELVAFFLDYLGLPENKLEASTSDGFGEPWVGYIDEQASIPSIIIWAPPKDDREHSINILNTAEPIKVWWYEDNQLIEVTNKTEAIAQYRHDYISNPDSYIWGYYELGILSIARDGKEAEMYLGTHCGPLCGNGTIYTLQRNESGQWEITGSELIWIS